ncbi:peptidase domain-containing ABC transporter [Duganella radicis]|uniref:ATP-binding cassette domain-containing protein n=1 Tax=Duganella radicis TaxID=551988 RepID=A0A6L6PC08_9BURK|nr:peptidase domain-containing ABC transporter [Duganella radicis]MTV36646.1 ATP-binding cassette domain-containing protein [Duganella radicis]
MQFTKQLGFKAGGKLPLILQTEASECSLACLAMIASHHGYETDLPELRRIFPISLKGVTLERLIEMADQLKLSARPLQLDLDDLELLQTPCILHWDLNHFVVLKQVKAGAITVLDPAAGEVTLEYAAVSEHFTGIALELTPNFDFRKKTPPAGIRLADVVGKVIGLKRGILQLLAMALVLEAISLLMPIANQWITDEAIGAFDRGLLALLCVGAAGMGVTHAILTFLRSWTGMYISTTFNLQWMSNVMGHLLHLPIDFFEKRHLGDILNRFGSVHAIERVLTTAMVEAVLDGLLAIGTLIMMLLYSPQLTLVTLVAVVLYCLLRWTRMNTLRLANQGVLVKQALEQTYFLETIRGVRSIKLFNKELQRKTSWLNRYVSATNASLAIQKMTLVFSAAWSILGSVERAAVLWLGALIVMDNTMTLGMLFAFLSFKEQFTGRVNSLVDKMVDLKMLSIQADRLSDIVTAAPEEDRLALSHDLPADLTLVAEKLSFRYSPGDPPVILNANFTIRYGECVAIVGPSGEGKTTTMKILLGILKPSYGNVLLGGIPIARLGLKKYRSVIATVMQDDQLYGGSLFDNICFFDDKPEREWIEQCARMAGIHDEIIHMPMGYHTLVGDMGTVLSGGQKQRVLLARALYKRPQILFLDEATSHLDLDGESLVNEAVAALKITRILIAHRPQTIAIADRVLRIEKGKFREERPARGTAAPVTHAAREAAMTTELTV